MRLVDIKDVIDPVPSKPATPRRPGSTRSARERAAWTRRQPWGYQGEFPPSWEFDKPPTRTRYTYTEKDWSRLATPRAGHAAHGAGMGPAKEASAAVFARDDFLKRAGYIDNPRHLLHARFHGTSAERERALNSNQMAAQAAAFRTMTHDQQRKILRNCWRAGRKVPELLSQKIHAPPPEIKPWMKKTED